MATRLTAVPDPLWGRITRATVNPTCRPVVPRNVPVGGVHGADGPKWCGPVIPAARAAP
ncbi:hypothetical protein GA0115254_1216211 [Streptomyces sp. Ncost-T10-10d]|nr:hypothetical protein GA0115254_1216211 [Streptomyces sp. Ncost-T10-10d]